MSENIVLQNEENVMTATFNITSENTTISLKNLNNMTSIDWGDGIIDSNLSHTYSNIGEYQCRIYNVTAIDYDAFHGCTSLTSVEIPDSVTYISHYAFKNCGSLTSVVIPDSVIWIGEYAFSECTSLASVIIGDSVTSIGEKAFYFCRSLTSVVIGDSVTSIGKDAFSMCTNLTSVVIPDGVTTIGDHAFWSCSITTVTLPTTAISSIPTTYLQTVVITSGDTIGNYAFSRCSNLTSVVIGDGVTSIGEKAFENCDNLTSVHFNNPSPIDASQISNVYFNDEIIFYVPEDSLEAYRTAWNGVIEPERIFVYDPLVTLKGLKEYHNTLKERYLDNMATQEWVNERLVGKTDYLGITYTLPNFFNAGAGDYCRVSAEFIYDEATGETAHIGDILIAVVDNPTQTNTDWDLIHKKLIQYLRRFNYE